MTETTSHQILCNTCKVPPKPIPDSQPEEWGCGLCGVHDTPENIIREAKQHAVEVIARRSQSGLRKVAKGSKVLKLTGKPVPHGVYRFITDIEA